ncbi:hypothetical protein [Amnibacterium kyonggiense]|uniref:DUF3558 domain-containing protein n=1 Tax=Amnibacterium kyonggiense TaxID=595671 RepID=A0A4R7FJ76_9MICO|nr:hypothetical protein [Amnibacterium kyonggiense]TDS75786.1 hypothetical protein CLV52_2894 [Amnibacterium kyonggiense]
MTTIRRTAQIAAALLALAALAGCTSNPVAARPITAAPTAAASTPAVATPTTPPPTQVAADATPVRLKCHTLVPTAVVQNLDPAFTTVKGWEPDAGSPSARLEDLKGTTCAWTTSAGDLLEVSVAKPSAKDATALKDDLVLRSQSVPTFGGEAYFQVVDHVGQADVFRGRTWLFLRSNKFFEPGDASAIVAAALDALGYGPKPTETPTPGATPLPTATATAG